MEGGKKALDEYGPVFSRDENPKAWLEMVSVLEDCARVLTAEKIKSKIEIP